MDQENNVHTVLFSYKLRNIWPHNMKTSEAYHHKYVKRQNILFIYQSRISNTIMPIEK